MADMLKIGKWWIRLSAICEAENQGRKLRIVFHDGHDATYEDEAAEILRKALDGLCEPAAPSAGDATP